MSEDRPVFVARDSDLEVLRTAWSAAREGTPQVVRLQAPFGGGRRALSAEFLRGVAQADDEAVIWRVNCLDQENGLQWLVRMYGSLIASLTRDVMRRGKIEMILNAQLPAQPKRVQTWYQQFISAMKESKTDNDSGQVQLRLPKDNPLLGLVEVVTAIARKVPLIIEIQNPYVVNSLALPMFVESVYSELAREGHGQILVMMFDEVDDAVSKSLHPMPMLDMYTRNADAWVAHAIAPWTVEETAAYLDSKGIEGNAGRLAEISRGRPGFIAELTEILGEDDQLSGDLEGITMASLVPFSVDESELEAPDKPPEDGERTHAGTDDIPRVTYLAALLGAAFPSNLVADMGGYERESVDDLLDAMGDLFEEVQFSKELGTWIYRFVRGSWREGVLDQNDSDEGRDMARRVGLFMERYLVPRGYGFIVKTARVYAENGAPERASVLRASALSNDAPDIWGLAYDFLKYFDELTYPDPLLRTVYMNLLDRLVNGGNVQAAEQVHGEVSEWATAKEDRELTAWLLFNGSKLDLRRQDLFRARDRAEDAIKMYVALENKARVAELHNHIASIELQDGNLQTASERVDKALEAGKVEGPDGKEAGLPGIVASAEQIRGLVSRRQDKLPEAIEHFKRANEIAGQTGFAALALDAGLSYGEALFANRQIDNARDALERVLQIARALRNPVRERQACELLAQAEASLRNFDKALPLAQRTLELSQALKFEQALPIDLYNLGFFHFVTKNPREALTYFTQSQERIGGLGNHPVVKELYYFKGLAHLQTGDPDQAKASLRTGLRPLQEAKDWTKLCSSLENLAEIERQEGNPDVARQLLTDAIGFAKQANLKDARKELRKKLDAIA